MAGQPLGLAPSWGRGYRRGSGNGDKRHQDKKQQLQQNQRQKEGERKGTSRRGTDSTGGVGGYKAKTHTACRHGGVGYTPLYPYLTQNICDVCPPPLCNWFQAKEDVHVVVRLRLLSKDSSPSSPPWPDGQTVGRPQD